MKITTNNGISLSLTEDELKRYNRQILLPSFGEEGQIKLKRSHVLIAGVGGLGSPVSIYLASAGIGRLTLVDSDRVELSNLNRQILHWETNIGERKVFSACDKLKNINSTIKLFPIHEKITEKNIVKLLDGVDLVIDCLDNMETRFILNEGVVILGIPMIHGGIHGLLGEITTIIPGLTPCLECIFQRGYKDKETFPVLGATPGVIATLQVMEAIKLIVGFGKLLIGKMLYVNGEEMEFITVDYQRKKDCKVCGKKDIDIKSNDIISSNYK
ncbi:MAG: adenylyltransferase [Deltaproteobacteria bacterium]|nr:HesA/MoeB/ThiF family protein [Deltaproteobacteria bacterium]RLA89353.1 MAG: adenylyltransferase [Deltaproteobacteria bacterium]